MKINCWEFTKCGRQVGGENVKELGICPAADYTRLDSAHGGKNAGRVCWMVAGTMCGGEPQGSFVKKYENCRMCEFYLKVKEEEGPNFLFTADLIQWLK
jgi:hypothetical protein